MALDDEKPMLVDGGGDFPEDLVGDLLEALGRLDRELGALAVTHSGSHLHAALDWLLTWLRRLVHADGGAIYLRQGEILRLTVVQNDSLEREVGLHTLRSWLQDLALPIAANSIAGYVARAGDVVNVPDVEHIPAGAPYEFKPALDKPTYQYRSVLAVPIGQEPDGVLGVLQLINALDEGGQAGAFTQGTEGLVRRYAVLAAHVIASRSDLNS